MKEMSEPLSPKINIQRVFTFEYRTIVAYIELTQMLGELYDVGWSDILKELNILF